MSDLSSELEGLVDDAPAPVSGDQPEMKMDGNDDDRSAPCYSDKGNMRNLGQMSNAKISDLRLQMKAYKHTAPIGFAAVEAEYAEPRRGLV